MERTEMIMFHKLRSLTPNFVLEIENKKRDSEELERSEAGPRLASCRLAVTLTEDLLGTARPMSHQGAHRQKSCSRAALCPTCRCRQDACGGGGVGGNSRAKTADSPSRLVLTP